MPTRRKRRSGQKKTRVRKSPSESATEFPEGSIRRGNDNQSWVVKRSATSQRWIPLASTTLFGFKPLTVDYIAKHVGKPIPLYERDVQAQWPKSVRGLQKATFTATGAAGPTGGRMVPGWLKTRRPAIKPHTMFTIDGDLVNKGSTLVLPGLQVDSVNKTLVSSNITNTEAFIKAYS